MGKNRVSRDENAIPVSPSSGTPCHLLPLGEGNRLEPLPFLKAYSLKLRLKPVPAVLTHLRLELDVLSAIGAGAQSSSTTTQAGAGQPTAEPRQHDHGRDEQDQLEFRVGHEAPPEGRTEGRADNRTETRADQVAASAGEDGDPQRKPKVPRAEQGAQLFGNGVQGIEAINDALPAVLNGGLDALNRIHLARVYACNCTACKTSLCKMVCSI
jgi:hypothetical protein